MKEISKQREEEAKLKNFLLGDEVEVSDLTGSQPHRTSQETKMAAKSPETHKLASPCEDGQSSLGRPRVAPQLFPMRGQRAKNAARSSNLRRSSPRGVKEPQGSHGGSSWFFGTLCE